MKLTKEQVKKLLPGQTLVITCDNTSELMTANETAKQTRRELGLDATRLPISCSGKTMTVTIRRIEKANEV